MRFLTSIVVDRSIYDINYSQAPTLENSFYGFFHEVIQSMLSDNNYEVHVQIFSSLVELLFLPVLTTMLMLILRLVILREFPH